MSKSYGLGLVLLLLSGRSSYGVIDNAQQTGAGSADSYSIHSGGGSGWGSSDIGLLAAEKRAARDPEMTQVVSGLNSYSGLSAVCRRFRGRTDSAQVGVVPLLTSAWG